MPALQNVPAGQLQWLIDGSSSYVLTEGEFLFVTGQPISGTHFIINGRIRLYLEQKQGIREVAFLEAGDITGHLPFSRGVVANVTGIAVKQTTVMTFPIEKVKDLILQHFELTQALVHVMTTRVRDFTALQQQNEKMMALGKLSAGLAHELNNPSAAIVRDSVSLRKHLQLQPQTFKKVMAIRMTNAQVDEINDWMFQVLKRGAKPPSSLVQRTQKEDELNDWLDDHGVSTENDVAENFVDFGFGVQELDSMSRIIPVNDLQPVLQWINNNLVTEKMVNDIQEASQRISDLVKAVKNFTHMDRGGEKEFFDVQTGLRNTLNMLGYRLKQGNIQLIEQYAPSVPKVHAYIGELNQVWTNLIDNAIDAMEPNSQGMLEITTKHDGIFVQVTITDNGPGVPEEIQSRIFDPFFTTKEIGKGTGLGLDVVQRIVKQHNGTIKLRSTPGKTSFIVCFPIG
jgi:signal transduction histidine kinase